MDLDKAKKISFIVEEIKTVGYKLITARTKMSDVEEVKFCWDVNHPLGSDSFTAYTGTKDALVGYYIQLLEEYKASLEKELSEM